jgi:hypothetical protein
LNCRLRVWLWPELSVNGNVAPVKLKPEPVKTAELMVTAPVPAEVRVRSCGVAAVLTCTLPNAKLLELTVNVGTNTGALSCREVVLDTVPAVPVRVAVWEVVTDDTVAVNPAVVAFAGTVTEAGTLTSALLLERVTVNPALGAAAVKFTARATVPAPVMEGPAQDKELKDALTVGFAAFNCSWNHRVTLPPIACRTGVCAVVTDEAVAVKTPVVEPVGTVTVAGTVTAELLLERLNVIAEVAAELRSTVQVSVPVPVKVTVLQ